MNPAPVSWLSIIYEVMTENGIAQEIEVWHNTKPYLHYKTLFSKYNASIFKMSIHFLYMDSFYYFVILQCYWTKGNITVSFNEIVNLNLYPCNCSFSHDNEQNTWHRLKGESLFEVIVLVHHGWEGMVESTVAK